LRWEWMTRDQQVRDCLVCGAPAQLREEPVDVEQQLRALISLLEAHREARWIRRLRSCDRQGGDRLFCVAHFLWHLKRDRCYLVDTASVDRLLYGIGLTFPETGPRPPGNPLVGGPAPPWI